jgi:hypothetical protein
LHERFHHDLYVALAEKGYRLSGQRGHSWEMVLDTPEKLKEAWEILKRVAARYDEEEGTHILPGIISQIAEKVAGE